MSNRTLVVMTNGDVYYIGQTDAERLQDAIQKGIYKIAHVTDVKSGAKLVLQLRHISAMVEDTNRG